MNVAVTTPPLPSVTDASAIDRIGPPPPPCGVTLTSSTASPSSAPVALKSCQRNLIVDPGGTERPVMTAERAARFAVELPSSAPMADVTGDSKSSASTFVQVPVSSDVASRLYWKSSRSTAPGRAQLATALP